MLLGILRMKRPDCSFLDPFLKDQGVVFEAGILKRCNNNSTNSRLSSACYKNGTLSSFVFFGCDANPLYPEYLPRLLWQEELDGKVNCQ